MGAETQSKFQGDSRFLHVLDRPSVVFNQVSNPVMAKVEACHKNILGESGTILEECLHATSITLSGS